MLQRTPLPSLAGNLISLIGVVWPQKFDGDKFFVETEYAPDEKNTPFTRWCS